MTDGPTRRRAATEERSGARRDRERPPAPGAAAAPRRRQPLPPRHRRRAGRRASGSRSRRPSPRPPLSECRGSCRSAATCPAPGGRSRRPPPTRPWSPASRCTPTRRPGSTAAGELDAALEEIERLARAHDRVRAVGETGLDHFRTGEEGRAAQVTVVPPARRPRQAARQDPGDPRPRRARRGARGDRRRGGARALGDALLLRRRRLRPGLPRPRRAPVLRRHRHLQERRTAARGAGRSPRATGCSSRPTRRT